MFDISRRRSLCQLLAPPAHFIFEAGVATTYTLDFMALTTSLRALSGRGSSNAEDSAAEELLKVLFGMRNRIVVFVNQASINQPSITAPKLLYELYDQCVRAVTADGHAFHPKLWLLKYLPETGIERDAIYRLVCSSRNISTAATIECGSVVQGRRSSGDTSFGVEVSRYLGQVLNTSKGVPASIRALVAECSRVHFQAPDGAGGLAFFGQKPSGHSLFRQLPKAGLTNVTLVTPFVGAGFLGGLLNRLRKNVMATVISRQEELDCLPDARWAELQQRAHWYVARSEAPGLDRCMELHAKVLFYDHGGQSVSLIGSANATRAAWGLSGAGEGRNWEAMLKVVDPTLAKRFKRDVLRPPTEPGANAWIQPYSRSTSVRSEWEEQVRELKRQFGALVLEASYSHKTRSLHVQAGGGDLRKICPPSVRVRIVPYALDQMLDRFTDGRRLWGRGVSFRPVTVAELSQFFTVEIQDAAAPLSHPERFIVRAEMRWSAALQAARDAAVRAVVAPNVRLIDLLLERLGLIVVPGRLDPPTGAPRKGKSRGRRKRPVRKGLLEAVLRTWVTRPSELHQLQKDLDSSHIDADDATVLRLKVLMQRLDGCAVAGAAR